MDRFRYKDLWDYLLCSHLIKLARHRFVGANFMSSEAVIKIEVSGRFNSLDAFRGFIGL